MRKVYNVRKLITSIMYTFILTSIYVKTPNGKLILFPFMICGYALSVKYIFMIINKEKYAKTFDKLYTIGVLLFMGGFLIFWCYRSIVDKQYLMILATVPFWIFGIYIVKKRFIKNSSVPKTNKLSKFNFPIVISCLLVGICLLSGILMLFFGIKGTYSLNKQTKGYITTDAYFYDYDVFNVNKNGTTYKLNYKYTVNDKEYNISTDYGTNYIPDVGSIREVKYNPNNPEESILVGTNNKNGLIYGGLFFTFVSLTFVIVALTGMGVFDKFKIDVISTYIGFIFVAIGIGIILLQNGTTMYLLETIKNMGLWIFIPIMFVVVGIQQLVQGITNKKDVNSKKKSRKI